MIANLQNNCSKSNIAEVSIWKIIDLALSQHCGGVYTELIAAYNNHRPTTTITDSLGRQRTCRSGCIRDNARNLGQELIYLSMCYLETLRRSDDPLDQQQYIECLSSNSLPVITNRKELADKTGLKAVPICRNSIYNYLNLLIDAGIILEKRNTSRRRIRREDGTTAIENCRNGRGDFKLFLNKRIFAFRAEYQHIARMGVEPAQADVENDEKRLVTPLPEPAEAAERAKLTTIENQPLSSLSSQDLEQLISTLTKTRKKSNNNRSELPGDQSGVPAGQLVDDTGLCPELKKLERSSIISDLVAPPQGENSAAAGPRDWIQAERETYEKKRELAVRVARLTAGTERQFYLKLLQMQFIAMLYPIINRAYLQRIRQDLLQLLGIYLDLFSTTPQEGFQRLSRAIEMVYRYLEKHPEYRLYDPISFLRRDYANGFMKVVKDWLPKEELRLQLRAEKHSHLMKWQRGQAFADDLFKNVLESLRSGFYNGQDTFALAKRQLADKLDKIQAGAKTRARITASFNARFEKLYEELALSAMEREDLSLDPTWKTFLRYLKLMDIKGDD